MPVQALSHQKYLNLRSRFALEVNKSPVIATLVYITPTSSGSFTDLTGESARTEGNYNVKCLYDRNMTEYKRSKFGLTHDVSGLLYLSPIHIAGAVPSGITWADFFINFERLHVILYGERYQVGLPRFKEPLYNTYIAVELHLKNIAKGVE